MIHLKLKRVYETAAGTDGTRFLVERLWPRGISKERALLAECGFGDGIFYDSLGGSIGKAKRDLFAVVAKKK